MAAIRLGFGELAAVVDNMLRKVSASTFTVYSDVSLSMTLIMPIVGDFQRIHPELEVRVLSSFESIDTTRDDFDVGIQYGRDLSTDLVVEPIADDVVFPVFSPELAAKLRESSAAKDLLKSPLLPR